MPTVLRVGRFRFFFFSNEGQEPAHIHVKAGDDEAKFWLDPVRLAESGGFGRAEIRKLESVVRENETKLRGTWDEYFSD